MFVLGGPRDGGDPCDDGGGSWEFLGPVRGMPAGQWAIDGTVFELNDTLYFAYSGWPIPGSGSGGGGGNGNVGYPDLMQELYITRLEDPITVANTIAEEVNGSASPSSPPRLPAVISRPERDWEFTMGLHGRHGINEGPQFLRSPSTHNNNGNDKEEEDGGGWAGLVYSCGGSWTSEYKMATLRYVGGDPLRADAWRKAAEPLIAAREPMGPWGPGHGSFVHFTSSGSGSGHQGGDGAEGESGTLAIFHATDLPTDGWADRRARVQRVSFSADGPFSKCPCSACYVDEIN